jgi:hypothetical protein
VASSCVAAPRTGLPAPLPAHPPDLQRGHRLPTISDNADARAA